MVKKMRTRVNGTDVTPDPMTLGNLLYRATYNSSWQQAKKYTYSASVHSRSRKRSDICVDTLHSGPPYRTGGPLDVRHLVDGGISLRGNSTIEKLQKESTGFAYRYVGGFVCASKTLTNLGFLEPNTFREPLADHSFGDVSSWGPKAWNKFRPCQPGADLALFIAELKDVPRMLRTTCKGILSLFRAAGGFSPKRSTRAVANHYLNTQFGWLPFLSDLRNFANAYATLDEQIQQIVRDNGRWVRRGGTLFVEDDATILEQSNGTAHYPNNIHLYVGSNAPGFKTISETTYQKVKFSARFRYYIPNVETNGWKRKARRKLFGATVNPALVWNATPWSWLIDWGTNAGDVFANMDNGLAENLAAKYAYIMGETQRVVSVSSHYPLEIPSDCTWHYRMQRKTRESASPFGFGLTGQDFSARQWSILSALGLSRLGR